MYVLPKIAANTMFIDQNGKLWEERIQIKIVYYIRQQ